MTLIHLLASPFLGGPERQALGLASALLPEVRTVFLSFAESGKARPLLDTASAAGFEAVELHENFPRLDKAIREVADHLRRTGAQFLLTSGYKPDIVGWRAARRAGTPVVAVAHGWTGVTWKVRLYERIDAFVMRRLDAVVCVSEAMAGKVRRHGVRDKKIVVIRNALDATRFDCPDPQCRQRTLDFFPSPPSLVVGAAGRLSPEKGFDIFIEAAARVARRRGDVGFLLFGAGPLEQDLRTLVRQRGLEQTFIFAGFRTDLERFLPGFDLAVLSSHTEGLPVAVLEAGAAGLPVVATAVGGTPEVIDEGRTGFLVPPADPEVLAARILDALQDRQGLVDMGRRGRERVRSEFTFAAQARRYRELFARLVGT